MIQLDCGLLLSVIEEVVLAGYDPCFTTLGQLNSIFYPALRLNGTWTRNLLTAHSKTQIMHSRTGIFMYIGDRQFVKATPPRLRRFLQVTD